MLPYHYVVNEDDEFFTAERCHILELLNEKDDRSQSIARAQVESGIATAWHRLKDTTETYIIVAGTGLLEVNEDISIKLNLGDTYRIPPNAAQRITNTGVDDLIFLCVCVPAFSDASYELLE